MDSFLKFAALPLGVVLAVVVYRTSRPSGAHVGVTGPPALPLLGNALDMPTRYEWVKFDNWKEIYGPIISLKVFGQSIFVLGTAESASLLLDKHSAINSDRPELQMAGKLVGWDGSLALTPYGSRFREMRKLFQQTIGPREISKWNNLVEMCTTKMLMNIMKDPAGLNQHVRDNAGAIILMITFGYQVKKHNDPLVRIAEDGVDTFSKATLPAAFLVDIFPILRHFPAWFPGAGFKKIAARWRKLTMDLADVPYEMVKSEMATGKGRHSFLKSTLEDAQEDVEKQETAKWAAASMYSGGADTTVSVSNSFFLAMALYPEVQAKARSEIDRVVGTDRLPGYQDRDSLPYLDALVKEVLRWNPVAPLAIPHRSTENQVVAGQTIPKGSLLIANVWGMTHDEQTYKEPHKFEPQRFLGQDEIASPPTTSIAFGFGRRVCPGRELADASLWIAVALTIATMNIGKPFNSDGKEMKREDAVYSSGAISHPPAFQCRVEPRSTVAKEMLERRAAVLAQLAGTEDTEF